MTDQGELRPSLTVFEFDAHRQGRDFQNHQG